jgi:hypothetical protein
LALSLAVLPAATAELDALSVDTLAFSNIRETFANSSVMDKR